VILVQNYNVFMIFSISYLLAGHLTHLIF